jgi:two-component system CheB/CheR fusion protein
LAGIAVALAVLVRLLLDPVLSDYGSYAFLIVPVAFTAWYAGWRFGLLCTFLALLAGDYFWGEPRYSLALTTAQEQLRCALFLVASGVVCRVAEGVRAARYRSEVAEREREESRRRAGVAEAALATSEREFRAMFELAGVGQAGADARTGRFLRVNRRLCEITGYSEEELLQRTYRELTHPEDRERDLTGIRAALEGESSHWTTEKRYVRKNGAVIWVEVTGVVVRDDAGAPVRTLAVMQDITARRRAEGELRAREEQLRLMADALPAMISYVDAEEHYRFVNRRYEEWFAQPRAQLVDRTMRDVLGEAAYAEAQPHIVGALSGRATRYESWIDFPGAGLRYVLAQYVPDVEVGGEVRGFFILVQDLTEQKQTETALREADRRKDEFLAMLAHELRNPLAPMLTSVRVLEQCAAPGEPPLAAAQRAVIDRQTRHMARLLDDLLDVSRITRGKTELRTEVLDLTALLRALAESSATPVREQGLSLRVSLPDAPVWVEADAARLQQVVGNLITNAAKYTPAGGEIFLELEARECAVIRVRDTGIGISPEFLPHVFELFSQGEPALSRASGGLGVGLTLVKSLVELHGGEVEARSAGPGRGSEFEVRLPLTPRAPAPAPPATPAAPALAGGSPRVLVVDDNRDAGESLAELLALWGWETHVATDGRSGLAQVEALRPEVVILDIGMPGLDGYQVARELRRREQAGGAVPRLLIALTGFGQREDRERALAAGFDQHLTKPADPDRLRVLLEASMASPIP